MSNSRIGPALGFLVLLGVVWISLLDRGQTEIHYFDWHAGAVVLGGVVGSLMLALNFNVCLAMLKDLLAVITARDLSASELNEFAAGVGRMQSSWKEGRRAQVLSDVESGSSPEIRTAAEALIQRSSPQRLIERFEFLRARSSESLLPQIEGWDMVGRLGPSFGIVGTVAGMVALFRNMGDASGNLGGSMALALLSTLYGILIGTALGGPMSTRINNLLNRRMGLIDLLERQTAALIDEDRRQTDSRP